jgi:putative ABC transport system ATP-binding protein
MIESQAVSAMDLTKIYHRGVEEVHALRKVNFTVGRGEFVSIMGPSGSGKTTLLNLIGCMDNPSDGSLKIMGQEVSRLKEKELVKARRKNIGFVFQQFFLLPTLTVEENIELPLLFKHGKSINGNNLASIISAIGLESRANHRPHELSGGEMQRVAIGRALVHNPQLLLADEPTGNLDSTTAQKIFDLFRDLNLQGLTVIIVTHNMELARLTRRIIPLKDGEIV